MQPDHSVWVREPYRACDGTGKQRVPVRVAHSQWSRRVLCESCEGAGQVACWVGLAELRRLLDEA
ncbi:MAG: hypothetical protein GEU88_10095 [Solirubrobacterales bacterium]|nr:hypothetical protein [Solirubrobacterales bacterium]